MYWFGRRALRLLRRAVAFDGGGVSVVVAAGCCQPAATILFDIADVGIYVVHKTIIKQSFHILFAYITLN